MLALHFKKYYVALLPVIFLLLCCNKKDYSNKSLQQASILYSKQVAYWQSNTDSVAHYAKQLDSITADMPAVYRAMARVGMARYQSFRVERPWTGNNFYRLKMMDTNGSYSYSPVVLLRDEDAMQLSIYPNPAADVLYINLPAQSTPLLGIPAYVFDAKGKTVLQTHLQFGSINALSIKALPAGMYIIQCNINGKPFALKFLKSN